MRFANALEFLILLSRLLLDVVLVAEPRIGASL